MASEKLIVQLDADTKKLDAGLKATDKNLDSLDKSTQKADKSFSSLTVSSATLAKGVGALAAGVGALATSLSVAAVSAADYAKEIKIASQLSGESVKNIQLMSAATATVGVSMEQLGDISKDTLEKIGDYLNTGGGGFMDFVDAMKLTEEQAIATANEFKTMSGPQILQEMVSRMEEANISSVQMSHALEGMASDTTKLIPLLLDGGKAMRGLSDAALSVSVPLSEADIQKFEDLKISADNAALSLHSLGNTVLLELSDWFIKTADTAAHFYGTLNAGSIAEKTSRLADIKDELDDLRMAAENAETGWGRLYNTLTFNTSYASDEKVINDLLEERARIYEEINQLQGSTLPELGSSESSGEGSEFVIPEKTEKTNESAIEALQDRFKSEEELLLQKYERETELAKGNQELLLELENEYIENLIALDEENIIRRAEASSELWREALAAQNQERFDTEIQEQQRLLEQKLINEEDYLKSVNAIGDKYGKVNTKDKKKENKDKEKSDGEYTDAALGAATALFGNNKAVKAANVVVDSAAGISKAFADLPYPAAVGASVQIAATGIAQLAAITSASPSGGGSVSSPSSSASTSSSAQADPSVTGDIEINESIAGGSSTRNTVTITAEDGDTLAEAFASVMNKKLANGDI